MRTRPRSLAIGGGAALALFLSLLAAPLHAQSFAVGAGGSLANDTGSVAHVGGFETWGGFVFGELDLEQGVVLQLRASRFGLPGSETNAPNVRVTAGNVSVAYLFREAWFRAGLFGGIGGYHIAPNDLEYGQSMIDHTENAFGWWGGVETIFEVTHRLDVRLEGSGHVIRTDADRKPILISLAVAYHF